MQAPEGQEEYKCNPFPCGMTLARVREAVKGLGEFREYHHDDHIVFTYAIVKRDTFPDPSRAPDAKTAYLWKVRRECRGLIFSAKPSPPNSNNYPILSRRFHKFFNLDEAPESSSAVLSSFFASPHPPILLEKLDGSMIVPYFTLGRIRFATRKGVTAMTEIVENHVQTMKNASPSMDYELFCKDWINKGWTVMFEWCSRKTAIILDYPEDRLTLISMRNMETGNYLPYSQLVSLGQAAGIPVVKSVSLPKVDDQNTSGLEQIKKMVGLEGCVMKIEQEGKQELFKVKTKWYHDLCKGMNKLIRDNEKYMWSVVLENTYDDMKSYISSDERGRLDAFADKLISEIEKTAKMIFEDFMRVVSIPMESADDAEKRKRFSAYVSGMEMRQVWKEKVKNKEEFKVLEKLMWDCWKMKEKRGISEQDVRDLVTITVVKEVESKGGAWKKRVTWLGGRISLSEFKHEGEPKYALGGRYSEWENKQGDFVEGD